MSEVLKVTVYLADLADYQRFNELYRAWFEEPLPARTACEVKLLAGFSVEIDAIARVRRGDSVANR